MRHRPVLLPLIAALAVALIAAGLPVSPAAAVPRLAAAADGPNLAAGRPVTVSSTQSGYPGGNATDGNQGTYWESANHAFPQWIQVDLGRAVSVDELVLRLPAHWESRTQTLEVRGSVDGGDFTQLSAPAARLFNPAATITFGAATVRYIRLNITANTGWPAAQLSEFEVYGPGQEPDPGTGSDLALGKPIEASSHTYVYVAGNANDGDVTTYWEGDGHPSTLTVSLGANADISSIVLKLNPAAIWGTRTQTIQVLGRAQNSDTFANLVSAAAYTFNPATGNTVTIPVNGRAADVRLRFTSNSGAPGGQVAEFQVIGEPAPNPDLTVTGLSWTPASPAETDAITLSATVRNAGTVASGATTVAFRLGDAAVGAASVGALAPGATATVTRNIGARDAGTHSVVAVVDPDNAVIERDEGNNSHTAPSPLVIRPVDSSDLVAGSVSWTPGNPAAGDEVTFTVTLRNQGTVASAGGAHGVTLTVVDSDGDVVRTLNGAFTGVIAPGATTAPVSLGTWTAANGEYTIRTVIAADANELPVKRDNNARADQMFVGRGARMPYDMYEAEDAVVGGGAAVVGPNRTVGDLAGEASGRRAVTLNTTGAYVEFTTKAPANTLVTRFSIPDAPGGGGIDATLNVYVNGTFHKAINLTSRYAWLYGDEAGPSNSPSAGPPRHIYDEAHVMLNGTVPAGSRIRLQKDAANTSRYAIDFINLEQVSPIANPDPARYAVPAGFTHQDVQNALDRARQDSALEGVYLPPGDYQTNGKFHVYGKAVKVVGAGPWYTKFHSPAGQENTDVGWRTEPSSNGSTFANFAHFGNYTNRIDGPGKIFDMVNVSRITIDNIWAEHQVCLYWGSHVDHVTIKNSRIRNMFADGGNFTNGSTDNLVSNVEARATGDDSFALFAATDGNAGDQSGNVLENLTSILTWRAAGIAVYGGQNNTVRNVYIADTLTYPGITISSLDFGYPMRGFGPGVTRFENISIVRAGGHFWGAQTFPALWVYSAQKKFQAIRVSNVDIVDPTYHGIMFQTNYKDGVAQNPITDTVFTNVKISGARKSGDAYDAKSGFGIWANELPEPDQGPAVGSATFTNLTLTGNHTDIRNITTTFTINRN